MKLERGPVPIYCTRELIEEALLAASNEADSDTRREFRNEREAVESIETIDIREKRQDALDRHWVERLQLVEPLERILASHPDVENVVSRCDLRLTRAKEAEGAFLSREGSPLVEAGEDRPALVVWLTVDTLLARDKLEPLIKRTLARAHHATLPPKAGG